MASIWNILGKLQTKKRSEIGTGGLESNLSGGKKYPHGVSAATNTIPNKFLHLSGLAIFHLGWLENVSCVH